MIRVSNLGGVLRRATVFRAGDRATVGSRLTYKKKFIYYPSDGHRELHEVR